MSAMASDVILARAAERDRDRIVSYLAEGLYNPGAALRFHERLDLVLDNLAAHPEMYPRATEGRLAAGGYRRAGFLSYVALYRIRGGVVEVARIFHALQDYARLL